MADIVPAGGLPDAPDVAGHAAAGQPQKPAGDASRARFEARRVERVAYAPDSNAAVDRAIALIALRRQPQPEVQSRFGQRPYHMRFDGVTK